MLEAADFQQAFGAMLAAPDTVADSAIRRALTIHRNTASKAARDALFANFPVVAALVGEDAFAACASSYVDAVPPAEARLCLYGDRFAAFVDAWAAFAEAPYLGAVGSVERLVVEALFAAYFEQGLDIGDPVVLADIAEAAGMERLVVLQLLSEGADKEAVAREHAMAVQGGVTGVPFAIFAGKVAVVGAETPERIAEAIDQALAA